MASSENTVAASRQALVDIREQARVLADQIRAARRNEEKLYGADNTPDHEVLVGLLNAAVEDVRTVADKIDTALDVL